MARQGVVGRKVQRVTLNHRAISDRYPLLRLITLPFGSKMHSRRISKQTASHKGQIDTFLQRALIHAPIVQHAVNGENVGNLFVT